MYLAVAAALASAACFAAGAAIQHRAAHTAAGTGESGVALFARLIRRRSWIFGLALSGVAFTLHVFALSQGDLALVQPVIVSGVVFAVLIRAGLDRMLPPRQVLVWLPLTWAGLALFLVVRPDGVTGRQDPGGAIWFVSGTVLMVVFLQGLASRMSAARLQGLLLGAASGALFGVVAGLAKTVVGRLDQGAAGVLTHWSVYALAVVGVWAVLLNQRAYQVARLSVSAPILNIAEVFVAVGFGIVVFGEKFGATPGALVGELVGLAVVVLGVYRLASIPDEDELGAVEPVEAGRSTAA